MSDVREQMAAISQRYHEAMVARVEDALWDVLKQRHPRQQLDQRRRDAHAYALAAIRAMRDFGRGQAQPVLHEDGYPVEEMGG